MLTIIDKLNLLYLQDTKQFSIIEILWNKLAAYSCRFV